MRASSSSPSDNMCVLAETVKRNQVEVAGPNETKPVPTDKQVDGGSAGILESVVTMMQAMEARHKEDMRMMQEHMLHSFKEIVCAPQPQSQMMLPPGCNEHMQMPSSSAPWNVASTVSSSVTRVNASQATYVREQRIKDLAKLQAFEEMAAIERAKKMMRLETLLEHDNAAPWP